VAYAQAGGHPWTEEELELAWAAGLSVRVFNAKKATLRPGETPPPSRLRLEAEVGARLRRYRVGNTQPERAGISDIGEVPNCSTVLALSPLWQPQRDRLEFGTSAYASLKYRHQGLWALREPAPNPRSAVKLACCLPRATIYPYEWCTTMKRQWTRQDLADHWTRSPKELELLRNRVHLETPF